MENSRKSYDTDLTDKQWEVIAPLFNCGEMRGNYGKHVDISERIVPKGWKVQSKRWIIGRTFGWLNNPRRLSKDFEVTTHSAEAMIKISHVSTLLKRVRTQLLIL